MVINKKTAATRISSKITNHSHLNAVVGIVVASVAGVAVAVGEEDWWVMGTRIAESGNPARFSRKGGKYILIVSFPSRNKLLIEHLSLAGVGTETNATSVTKLIEVPAFFIVSP